VCDSVPNEEKCREHAKQSHFIQHAGNASMLLTKFNPIAVAVHLNSDPKYPELIFH
jgi:hypothetical protein